MTERTLWKAAVFAAFLLIFGVHAPRAIASINVSPVRIELSEDHNKDVVRISNQEDAAKSYQVEVVAWSQTDERREVYSPTDELLAVPPLFTLQPGEEQVVRVGMIADPDPKIERAYRMFITEIAPPKNTESRSSGVSMRLQIGIPVFVAPAGGMPYAALDYIESMQIDNQLFMRFRNPGNMHIKVTEIQFAAPGLADKVVTPAVFYVLPGQMGYLPVALPDGEPVGTVTFVTDTAGTLEYELPIAP